MLGVYAADCRLTYQAKPQVVSLAHELTLESQRQMSAWSRVRIHRSQVEAEQVALVQVAKASMAAVARPCPLSHHWASRAVLGISVWVAIYAMAEAAVVSARHRAHAGSPLSESCLRIVDRRHQP